MREAARNPWFETDQVSGVTVVTFLCSEIVQQATVDAVSTQLLKFVEYFSSRHLVLNLGSVHRMSSLMLGKLLTLNERVRGAGGQLVLCNLTPEIQDVLKVVKLLQTFRITATEADALKSF